MEPQKYKIYINGTPVLLISTAEMTANNFQCDKNNLLAPYIGKKKMLLQYIDLLDKNSEVESVVLYSDDLPGLWADFKSSYKVLEAAGGYLQNAQGELLVFFRRSSWDMPKGKIDPGETPEQAAVREVQEETGIQNITLGAFLTHTYHTYMLKEKRILKVTWWYHMQTTDAQTTPQTEEDIEEIRWVSPTTWLDSGVEVYGNIRDVIELGVRTEN